MGTQNYKKWTIVILMLVIFGFAIFTLGRKETGTQEYYESPIPKSITEFNTREKKLLEMTRQDPDNAKLLSSLGDLYFENRRFDQAIENYNKVLELDPSDVDTYNDLGLAQHYTGRSEIAIVTLKKGTEIGPLYQRIWLSLGFVLASIGNNDEAQNFLNKAQTLDPTTDVGREAQRILSLIEKK